jgi:hypothetical protein
MEDKRILISRADVPRSPKARLYRSPSKIDPQPWVGISKAARTNLFIRNSNRILLNYKQGCLHLIQMNTTKPHIPSKQQRIHNKTTYWYNHVADLPIPLHAMPHRTSLPKTLVTSPPPTYFPCLIPAFTKRRTLLEDV